MERPSTNDVSLEEKMHAMAVGVMILMSNELQALADSHDVSEDDFKAVLEWCTDWNFDIPFILAKYNYFDAGVSYTEAQEIVDELREGYETLDLKTMIFIFKVLLQELAFRIDDMPSSLQGTFSCTITMVKGQVSAT